MDYRCRLFATIFIRFFRVNVRYFIDIFFSISSLDGWLGQQKHQINIFILVCLGFSCFPFEQINNVRLFMGSFLLCPFAEHSKTILLWLMCLLVNYVQDIYLTNSSRTISFIRSFFRNLMSNKIRSNAKNSERKTKHSSQNDWGYRKTKVDFTKNGNQMNIFTVHSTIHHHHLIVVIQNLQRRKFQTYLHSKLCNFLESPFKA